MSFLEQKKRILERQQEIERQKQQHKTYYGSSYSQKPQFNRPPSTGPPPMQAPQQQFSSYPPAVYPTSRYSFNQWRDPFNRTNFHWDGNQTIYPSDFLHVVFYTPSPPI